MPDELDPSAASPPCSSYAYKASLVGSAYRFELTDAGLGWHVGGRSGLWPYADIASVRLSYRPVSMQSHRFRADVRHVDGGRLIILSTSWQTAALMTPQDQNYRAFIAQLHARMANAAGRAALVGGLTPRIYAAAILLSALIALAMAGLLIRAIMTGEFAGGSFLIGFAALFGWQIGGFIRRNRPRTYTFNDLPETLLP